MSMSQQDFEHLADGLASLSRWVEYLELKPAQRTLARAVVDQAVTVTAQACKKSNSRFNEDRFVRWITTH